MPFDDRPELCGRQACAKNVDRALLCLCPVSTPRADSLFVALRKPSCASRPWDLTTPTPRLPARSMALQHMAPWHMALWHRELRRAALRREVLMDSARWRTRPQRIMPQHLVPWSITPRWMALGRKPRAPPDQSDAPSCDRKRLSHGQSLSKLSRMSLGEASRATKEELHRRQGEAIPLKVFQRLIQLAKTPRMWRVVLIRHLPRGAQSCLAQWQKHQALCRDIQNTAACPATMEAARRGASMDGGQGMTRNQDRFDWT